MKAYYLLNLLYAFLMSILIFLSKYIGGLALYGTAALFHINKNIVSETVNQNTESKHRATTLSTFNLLTTAPYAIMVVSIGKLIDSFSARLIAFYFGLILFSTVAILYLNYSKEKLKVKKVK